MDELKSFKIKEEREIVKSDDGKLSWIENDLITPSGEKVTWSRARASNDVVVIVPLAEDNEVYLKREWRLSSGDFVWEFPSGYMEKGEEIFETAQREVQEEIGFKAGKLEKLATFALAERFSATYHLVLASNLTPSKLESSDKHEHLQVGKFSIEEARKKTNAGEGGKVYALLALSYLEKPFKGR